MTDFLKTANGEAIRADLINKVFHDEFKVYGTTDTNEHGIVLFDARSADECETYIDLLVKRMDVSDIRDSIIFKARIDIFDHVLFHTRRAETDEDSRFDTAKLKKYFRYKYRSNLIQDVVNDLGDRGYVENAGYAFNIGNCFNIMAHPSLKAIQWMLNNLFYYYSVGNERTYDEIFTQMRSSKEVSGRWPKYPDHHTKMVIQAMKDTGFLSDGVTNPTWLKILKEPEGDWNEDGGFKEYKVSAIREATLQMDPADYVEVDEEGEPLFDTVPEG